MEIITATRFHEEHDLPDWRYILGSIHATFHLGSYSAAAAFATSIANASDRADHHPDIDIRYPGVVRVRLVTHAAGGITDLDMSLADEISALASAVNAEVSAAAATECEIAIDAMDIPAVRTFWRAAFDYVDQGVDAIVDRRRMGPSVWFQQMEQPRPDRNNIHIDISVTHDVAEQRVADVIAAGGRLVSDIRAPAFWVLADPEGNEACICTWQARD